MSAQPLVTCRIDLPGGSLGGAAKRIREASLTDLTYRFPLGTVVIEGGGVVLSVEDVTVFDFARGMLYALKDLEKDGEAEYEFTEGEGSLLMSVDSKHMVRMTADFDDGTIVCDYEQLSAAVRGCGRSLLDVITASSPEALRNPHIAELAASLEYQSR